MVVNTGTPELDYVGAPDPQPYAGERRHRDGRVPPAGAVRPARGRREPADLGADRVRQQDPDQPRHREPHAPGGPVPEVRRGPLHGGRGRPHRVDLGRLHHHGRVPVLAEHRPRGRHGPRRGGAPGGDGELHPELGEGHGGRLRRDRHVLRGSHRADHPGVVERVPRHVHADGVGASRASRRTSATRRTCSRCRPTSSRTTTSPTRRSSTRRRTAGRSPTTPPSRRTTTRPTRRRSRPGRCIPTT